jgi:hypothetical protein
VCRIVFAGDRAVADHGPAGGPHHLHVQAVPAVEAHRIGHDDGRGAGDRDEADLEVALLRRGRRLRQRLARILQRQEALDGREQRPRTEGGDHGAARRGLGEDRAQRGLVDLLAERFRAVGRCLAG